jgi:hypothetical protein
MLELFSKEFNSLKEIMGDRFADNSSDLENDSENMRSHFP